MMTRTENGMRKFVRLGAAALIGALLAAPAMAQEGTFLRKGKQIIVLTVRDGKLYCTRQSDGFEMCNGMTKQPDGTWQGRNMRHPAMPRFMKFRGTVTFTDTGLNIRGCALGICKAENWTAQ